jgi:hypothetical protein
MATQDKRRKWTAEDDMTLLIQVAADQPFAADKGQVSKAWQTLADTLNQCDHFTRFVDGKKAQNRFISLVDEHRHFDATSAKLSGVDEAMTSKLRLLDDIVSLLNDVKMVSIPSQATNDDDKDKIENGGMIVREMAMKTLKRRVTTSDDNESSKKKATVENRRNSLAAAIEAEGERERASREKELDFKRYKFDNELKQREFDREERKAEREHQLAMAKIKAVKEVDVIRLALESRK